MVVRSVASIVGFLLFSVLLVVLLRSLMAYLGKPAQQFAFYAYGSVFLVSMLTSASILVPVPTGLPFAVAIATSFNPIWVAVAMSLGSTLGDATSYLAGYLGGRTLAQRHPPLFHRAEGWMRRYGIWSVFLLALLPLFVFDLAGIAAGVLRLPLWQFLLATFAGRLPRAFVEVYTGGRLLHIILALFGKAP